MHPFRADTDLPVRLYRRSAQDISILECFATVNPFAFICSKIGQRPICVDIHDFRRIFYILLRFMILPAVVRFFNFMWKYPFRTRKSQLLSGRIIIIMKNRTEIASQKRKSKGITHQILKKSIDFESLDGERESREGKGERTPATPPHSTPTNQNPGEEGGKEREGKRTGTTMMRMSSRIRRGGGESFRHLSV